MLDISISIVNFNTKDNLKKCLDSIKKNIKDISYEIIVVDNNSSDGSVGMLKDDFPFVRIISNRENLGATKAKNQSFAEANGRYILMLDSDIEILQGAFEEMFKFMEKNHSVGILGPKVLFTNGQMQHSCNKSAPNLWSAFINKFFFFANLRYGFYRSKIGDLYLRKKYNKTEEFRWVGGMCMLVRKEVINQVGGMDENYFIYFDDTDFCLMARNNGWQIYYLPSASVIHHMSKGVGRFRYFLYPKIFESELYFFKKHQGQFQANIIAIFIQIAMISRALLILPLFLISAEKDYLRKKFQAYRQVFCLAGRQLYGKAD